MNLKIFKNYSYNLLPCVDGYFSEYVIKECKYLFKELPHQNLEFFLTVKF